MKHIKSVDGFIGCYNGLAPKLCGNIVSAVVTQKVYESFEINKEDDDSYEEPTDEQK